MTDTLYPCFVGIFLGTWLLLSILTVARFSWVSGRRRWDVLQMLSGWRLFVTTGSAHPAALPILYRDRLPDGSVGPLRLAVSGTIAWSPRLLFWHSDWDLQVLVRRLAKDVRKNARALTGAPASSQGLASYRHLAHIIRGYPASSTEAEARQFVILATYGDLSKRPPVEVFQSRFHPL